MKSKLIFSTIVLSMSAAFAGPLPLNVLTVTSEQLKTANTEELATLFKDAREMLAMNGPTGDLTEYKLILKEILSRAEDAQKTADAVRYLPLK